MPHAPFRHRRRVTYSECTVGNHVYYARYLDLLEEARGEFFRHIGTSFLHWQEAGIIFPVTEANLRYKGAARYDDWLDIEVTLHRLDRIRVGFSHRITNDSGALLLEADTLHVCTSLEEKPRRIPDELAALLLAHVHEPAEPKK